MMRLLRAPHSGIFPRSFHLHKPHYARETIAESCSLWGALATAIIGRTGSYGAGSGLHMKVWTNGATSLRLECTSTARCSGLKPVGIEISWSKF